MLIALRSFGGWLRSRWYALQWRWSSALEKLPGFGACGYCRWAFPISELNADGYCVGCVKLLAKEASWRQVMEGTTWEEFGEKRKARSLGV